MTIQEIITRLNYLEKNGKQIQKEKGDYYWLQEINKWETLFCNHPDADKTSQDIIKQIKSNNCKVGIAVHPKINISDIEIFLDDIDCVALGDFNQQIFGNEYITDTFEIKGKKIKSYSI